MRSLLVGCRGVGRGVARAEASMEHGPSGRQFAVEVQVSDVQQDTGWKKRETQDLVTQGLECQARF